MAVSRDWDPARYGAFRDLRLRPALDLLAQVPDLPDGDVVDLGCGDGAVGPALAARFRPEHRLIGIDSSAAMLDRAAERLTHWENPLYSGVEQADIAGEKARTGPGTGSSVTNERPRIAGAYCFCAPAANLPMRQGDGR